AAVLRHRSYRRWGKRIAKGKLNEKEWVAMVHWLVVVFVGDNAIFFYGKQTNTKRGHHGKRKIFFQHHRG
ncbi:MAG TPA: hypothetical protein PLK03_08190, partial [Termitinemataceae bacterium]|nr:hypothetical protein [Termitinemataceae bacterium]HPQ00832.1 hypothetical protein [Termitinemataceae bacterium]